jgi:hypothetical protein
MQVQALANDHRVDAITYRLLDHPGNHRGVAAEVNGNQGEPDSRGGGPQAFIQLPGRIVHDRHSLDAGIQFLEQCHPPSLEVGRGDKRKARDIPLWASLSRRHDEAGRRHHDGDRRGCLHRGAHAVARRNDHVDPLCDEVPGKARKARKVAFRGAPYEVNVPSLDPPQVA